MILARYPSARLCLVGANPTTAVRRLAESDPTIEVTGAVPDVRPFLWRSAVAVAPLLVARGVQNKVLEAVAAGLPCVVTPAVYEGLPAAVLPGCVVGADAARFAEALIDLLDQPPDERRAIAARAHLQPLTWASQLAPLPSILADAVARPFDAQASLLPSHAQMEQDRVSS
jgi:glycosyltransferase involved in cell wall biosynthesis